MSDTYTLPLLARSTRPDSAPKPHPFAIELLLCLLRAGSAQTIVTSPDKAPAVTISDALINDPVNPGPTAARHAPVARYFSGETHSTAQSSAHGFEGWRAHLTSDLPIDRVVQYDFLNDEAGREPRVGRREVLNDVTGRELKVFRKSPCPPRSRGFSHDSDDDALG